MRRNEIAKIEREDWRQAEGITPRGTNSAFAPRDYSIQCKLKYLIAVVCGYHIWWCSTHHQPAFKCDARRLEDSDKGVVQMGNKGDPGGLAPGEYMHEWIEKDAVELDLPTEEIIGNLCRDNKLLHDKLLQTRQPQDYEQNLTDCTEAIDTLIEQHEELCDEIEFLRQRQPKTVTIDVDEIYEICQGENASANIIRYLQKRGVEATKRLKGLGMEVVE